MTAPAYDQLLERARDVALLNSTAALLAWDQETKMPAAGIAQRSRQMAQLATLSHERGTDPAIGDLLSACEEDRDLLSDPTGDAAVNVRELRRDYDRATKLPSGLVKEWAETTSLAQHEWAQAREASDFAKFRPWLEKLLALARQKAQCLGGSDTAEAWDALAEGFEPGATAAEIQGIFAPLRERLADLVARVRDSGVEPVDRLTRLQLPAEAQEEFVRFVIAETGFDFGRGRLDISTHPFSTGTCCDDVRITTRFGPDDILDALGSTMHEAGHGMYEQGLPNAHIGTPRGDAVSLGIHESQSRLWENQVGRSRAFWQWCQPHMRRFLGEGVGDLGVEELYRAANIVRPGLIRVAADEATYNLHVMVRFELEVPLVRGELEAADVPAEWNRLYREYLGVEVPDDAQGCLQDVHWSCGMFGYFPTYTLGNLYAGQLFAKARQDLGDLDGQVGEGDFEPLLSWLRTHVHAHGQRYRARDLCEVVTGAPLSAEPFLAYLEGKLSEVYELR